MEYKRLTDKDWHKEKFYGHSDCDRTILKRLWDLENKIEQGMLIELPCKVGDTVYVPWRWDDQQGVASVKVEEINFYDTQMHYMFLIDMESDDESFNQEFGGWKIDQSIGETVFLTREEAEKRLKELQE